MKTMNIGILAHVDAGKTTLTEQLLYKGGTIRNAGSVDSGTSITDDMEIEKKRGISVRTACASFTYENTKINIIDTPGHIDFAGEVERSLAALDGAILVVSAVEGIQSHTRIIWKALSELKIPTMFVINKVDRAGSNYKRVIADLSETFGIDIFPLTKCENEGESCIISENNSNEAVEDLLLSISDDELTEKYLENEIGDEEIKGIFFEKCKKRECFSAVVTSAKDGKGIDFLMKEMLSCLPDSEYLLSDKLSGVVFKIEHDKTMGVCAYVRLFGGKLVNRDTVFSSSKEIGKISQIRACLGARFADCGELQSGDIGAIYGLSEIKCGDVIGEDYLNRSYKVATPLMMVNVLYENQEEKPLLMKALSELSREDPLLNFEYSTALQEMYISITGVIQLEILQEIISERYNLNVSFSEPSVIFKETPKIKAKGYESYTMPKPCWAKVELEIEPLPRGSGLKFKSVIKDKIMPYRYQHHVELSVMRDCVKQGIFGWEVTDAEITLTGGEYHSIHTHPLDFFVATPVAFLRGLTNCETILLEPFVRVTMSADEDVLGTVIGNIIDMRGEFESPEINSGQFSITAYLPVQSSVNYPQKFSSLTSGKGTYFSEFYEYRECPKELYKTLPRRGVDPLDRPKWILYCRSAFGNEQ